LMMLDVSGWDRKIPLRDVYLLRTKGLMTNPFFSKDEVYDWVVQNTVSPIIAFGDGSVWRRPTGNNSGSNNTTTDNTIAHIIIAFYLVLTRYFEQNNKIPTYDEVLACSNFLLFGDDNASGFTGLFDDYDEAFAFIRRIYGEFGLTIKEKQFKIILKSPNEPFSGIEFLGSTALYKNGRYVPLPRFSKIAYSLTSLMRCESEDPSRMIDKISALWDLVSPCHDEELKGIVSEFAQFAYRKFITVLPPLPDTKIKQLDFALTGRINFALYLGFESIL